MKFNLKNLMYAVLVFIMVFTVLSVGLSTKVEAKNNNVISSTLNIAEARRNLEGPGYEWANRYSELTLNNLYIDTDDAYGLRLPKDCTVILKGNNYINAGKYGISCSGTVTFKGSGTLVIDAGEAGIYLISQITTHKVRLLDGKYTINAGKYGVLSEYADFSFAGESISINVQYKDGYAISGRSVNLVGGKFISNSSIVATRELVVDSIELTIDSDKPAFSSPSLKIKNIDIDGQDSYNGENSVHAKALKRYNAKSMIFGETVPGYVDYILLTVVAIIIVAAIVLPILHKKKKSRALYERLKAEGYLEV